MSEQDAAAVCREGRVAAGRAWDEFEKVGDRLQELHREHDDDEALEAFREVEDLVTDLDDALYEAREVFDDGI